MRICECFIPRKLPPSTLNFFVWLQLFERKFPTHKKKFSFPPQKSLTSLLNFFFLPQLGLNSEEEAFDLVLFVHPDSVQHIPSECSGER